MNGTRNNSYSNRGHLSRVAAAAAMASALALPGAPLLALQQQTELLVQQEEKLMPEEHRAAVRKVVVLPGTVPADSAITGSYEKPTDGLIDGVDKGRDFGVIRRDVGGIPIAFPIPLLTIPGAIFGGFSGKIKRQIQDFRDALTEDLADAAQSPLSNDALATDLFWRLREVPDLDPKVLSLSTPIPQDTDAILYVSFTDSSIDVDGKYATLAFAASATLRRVSDGQDLYEHTVSYQDTDLLDNWLENDKAAWKNYANFGRHYLGREITAELYERADIATELRPLETDSVSYDKNNEWLSSSDSATPTLAWSMIVDNDKSAVPWAATISPDDVIYDVEIYDSQRLVYAAEGVSGRVHTVEMPLEVCSTYRWSVRPGFKVGEQVRYGAWMRYGASSGNGNIGKAAAEAAAYIYDFAALQLKCNRR